MGISYLITSSEYLEAGAAQTGTAALRLPGPGTENES